MTATATKEKVTLPVATLLKALADVTRVTSGRHAKPILGNVLIGNGLVTGTNLEIKIDREIGEHCEPMLLPADRLLAILRSCHATENVTLARKGTSVTVKAGRGTWTLPTEDVAEFPTWEPHDLVPVCRMPADQFCRAARSVIKAIDKESSRYALGAVLIDVTKGNPTFVSTDGRRLHAVEVETDQAVDDSSTLVSAESIKLMFGLFNKPKKKKADIEQDEDSDETESSGSMNSDEHSVQIERNANTVVMSTKGATVTALLVEGKFQRWRDVFPSGGGDPAIVDRHELLAATRAAAVVTSEQSLGVDYAFADDTLTLSARSSEYGESKVKCPVDTSGGCCTVKLNPTYVRDYLTGLPSDEEPSVQIVTHGDGGAAVFKCGDYRGVVMPLAKE